MLEKRSLNTRIGSRLRTMIADYARESGLKDPVASLAMGRSDDDPDESIFFGYYERGEIPEEEPMRFIEADGIEFLITQDWLCDELDEMLVDFVDGRVVALPLGQDLR